MKKTSVLLFAVLFGLIGSVEAKSKKDMKKEAEAKAAKDAQMAEMMKRGMPSEGHKALEPLAGNFTFTLRWWEGPGAQPQEMKGTSNNSWFFGGRFLKEEVKGGTPEMPFEGMGIIGYDNLKGIYQSVWLDSMATGMMLGKGTYDPAAKTFNETSEFSDTMTGEKDKTARGVTKIVDANTNTYETYVKDAAGNEFKSMEITFKRVQ